MNHCFDPTFHTAHFTLLGQIAYGTRLPLWRVIPHRWTHRPCPRHGGSFPDRTWPAP